MSRVPASHRFCTAPMMERSDRHCRYLWRLLSRHALLYTEMITSAALRYGDRAQLLALHPVEHPVALQVGGSDPEELALCARLAAQWGYDEINLNCGCPSDRVQSGRFGAGLMAEPALVADCVRAMRAATTIPVTVKHRIGVDHQDEYSDLSRFVETVANAGCHTFIVHARKAWLEGLNPKENREVPPLRYRRVRQLKDDFPELEIILNGGLQDLDEAEAARGNLDGVMLGRAAYQCPYLLATVDQRLFGASEASPGREQVLRAYAAYCAERIDRGVALQHMSKHVLGLYHGQPGGKHFRRFLSEQVPANRYNRDLLFQALETVAPVPA